MPTYSQTKATFSSFTELETELNKVMREAQEKTLNIMLNKLEDFISEYVYSKSATLQGYHKDSSYDERTDGRYQNYVRTYDLYNIWKIKKPYISHGKVYGSIILDNKKLTHDVNLHQHTSPYGAQIVDTPSRGGMISKRVKRGSYNHNGTILSAEDYVHIINDGLDSSHSMFGTILPRPFWTYFNQWASANYSSIYETELQKILDNN